MGREETLWRMERKREQRGEMENVSPETASKRLQFFDQQPARQSSPSTSGEKFSSEEPTEVNPGDDFEAKRSRERGKNHIGLVIDLDSAVDVALTPASAEMVSEERHAASPASSSQSLATLIG